MSGTATQAWKFCGVAGGENHHMDDDRARLRPFPPTVRAREREREREKQTESVCVLQTKGDRNVTRCGAG